MLQAQQVLDKSEAMYEQLIAVYPNDARFLQKYIEILSKQNKTSQVNKGLERLYSLYVNAKKMDVAKELETEHPWLTGAHTADAAADTTSFLSFFEQSMFHKIIMRMRQKRLKDGEYLFRQGDDGNAMYIVLSGDLIAMGKHPETGKPVILNQLRKGSIVGELAFLKGESRSATVIASNAVVLLELTFKNMMALFEHNPSFKATLKAEASKRQAITQISRNRLLAQLPLKERERLAKNATYKTASHNKRLCEGGALIKEVYLLIEGVADLVYENHRGESQHLYNITVGDMIGDSAILKNAAFPADIVAITDVQLMALDLHILKDLVKAYPSFRHRLESLLETNMTTVMSQISRVKKARELD